MRPLSAIDQLSTFAPTLIDAALRGAVVLVGALILTHLLRRRNAAVRHLIWVGAILVQLLLPVFAVWGPKWNVAVPAVVASVVPVETAPAATPATTVVQTERAVDVTHSESPAVHRQIPAVPAAPSAAAPATTITRTQLLVTLWALGTLFVIVRLAIGTTIVARLARRGNRIDDGAWLSLAQRLSTALQIDRPLTLLRGNKLGVPVTWGIVYPVVLLPEDADNWPEERRRFVLVHEMAHVKRLDALTQLAGQFALAMFWFNPLVWIANRRMQMEREHACDDYVIRHGTAPSTYAEELLSMVRSLGEPGNRTTQPAFAALAMARRSEFEGRMLSILDPVLDRHPLSKVRTLCSAALALVLVVPLAALHPYQKQLSVPVTAVVVPDTSSMQARRESMKSVAEGLDSVRRALDEFPESFKVHITPAGEAQVTPVQPEQPAAATIVTFSGSAAKACDNVTSASSSRSTSIHASDDDQGGSTITYLSYTDDSCASATIVGRVVYSADETDVIDMWPKSRAVFRERVGGVDRELIVIPALMGFRVSGEPRRPEADQPMRQYRRNGQSQEFDDEGRQWFASFLPRVLKEAGVNISPRVARWKKEGGVEKVLSNVAQMSSSNAKRAHYEALLESKDLSDDDIDRIVRSASDNLTASSSDLRAILTRAAPRSKVSHQTIPALERAVMGISSSGDRAAVVLLYGETTDREMLLSVMRVTSTISSSGDRARILVTLAPRYLTANDRELERVFFDATAKVPSSGDLRRVLMTAMPYAKSPSVAAHIIETARVISSSGDRASVLVALVGSGAISTSPLRSAFFDATGELPSDSDRSRVLQAAAALKP